MRISKRLTCLAELVDKKSIIADIGCDHGFLPIYLVEHNICPKAYACDLREGPLSRAKHAIHEAKLDGTISTILTDGLYELPNDVDTVIIAGMGYETIQKILEDNLERVCTFKHLILQSNTDVPLLRKWLSNHCFHIIFDVVIKDGHFYHIIKCKPQSGRKLSEDEIYFGVYQKSSDFFNFCQFELNKTNKILESLSANHENYIKFYHYKKILEKKISNF